MDTDRCTAEVRDAVEQTADALGKLGVTVDHVADAFADAPEVWVDVAAPEFLRDHPELLERLDKVHPIIGAFLEYGRTQPQERRDAAAEAVAQLSRWFDDVFSVHDVVLAPATPYAAPRSDDDMIEVLNGATVDVHLGGPSNFTRPINLVGLPALAVPAGRSTESGMPLGVQLIGRAGSEADLIATAAALERSDTRFAAAIPPDR
jgi:Asp-tRNA(Asn)/Glu-tRNA(Gln) amidotransferase A subunit family amidase